MSTPEVQAEVDRLVAEELARRESAEHVSEAQRELQEKQNRELRNLAASAAREPNGAYGTGRDFSNGRDLSRREGVQQGAWAIAEDWKAELSGTEYALEDDDG